MVAGVDAGDGGSGAVVDAEAPVVAQTDDLVAGLEGPVVDLEGRSVEVAGAGEVGAGSAVEVIDVVAAERSHGGGVASEAVGPPVRHDGPADFVGVGAGDDAPVVRVRGEGDVDVPGS